MEHQGMVRRQDESDNKGPWWAQLLARYGFATAVAAVLIWSLLGDLRADVSAMRDEHLEMRFFLRAICNNDADTDAERANCVPPSER